MTNAQQKQLALWVDGKSEHNDENGECCPDFSCCIGEISSPEDRQLYADAIATGNEAVKMKMLGGFLGAAMAKHSEAKVHIAGTDEPEQEN